jgi:ubiquinone/menaquinone biosynthesis C-methylase UbiE
LPLNNNQPLDENFMDANAHLQKVKKFHDWDAEHYKTLRYHPESCEGLAYITRRELVSASINLNSGNALDIGCGPGIFTQDLLNKNLRVYSADLSIEMIKHAIQAVNTYHLATRAHFVVSDVSNICFSNSKMDIILCIGVICYITDYNSLLSEMYRVLKPAGKIIVQIDKIRWPSVYKMFVPLYQYLKSKITLKNYDKLNFKFNYFAYNNFIKHLEKVGFQVTDIDYYDYRIPFIDILFNKFSLKLGKLMFKNRRSKLLGYFAHGLLIKACKISEVVEKPTEK